MFDTLLINEHNYVKHFKNNFVFEQNQRFATDQHTFKICIYFKHE